MENNTRYYEGCGKEGPIRCIFFCEFHPTAGPILTCQVPEDFISKDKFEAVSVFLIPKSQLLRSILTITTRTIKILGFPMRIEDKKYPRNAYYFNVCFVCDSWARTVQYESVVKKLSDFLTVLEMENSFLSQREQNQQYATRLREMLLQVLQQLNSSGMCTLFEGSASTHLKVIHQRRGPPLVQDHQVPVFLESPDSFQTDQWDLTTQQVLPFIDGINHVLKIAALADVETNLVKTCLQNLVYYSVVRMVPIFQYSNSYSVTPKLRLLATDVKLQEECIRAVAKSGFQNPNLRDVFRIYCSMKHGTTIKDLCLRFNPQTLRIDEIRLVQFGMLHELIRRVQQYPVLIGNPLEELSRGEASSLYCYFNGQQSYDEICCKVGISSQQLESLIDRDHNVAVVLK
ncbi:nitrogen permease regulator-like 2 isoform X1 [Rhodnius prolixus]|uniref:Uncharacterized protein n=2 Tax=Rhodnius prolixus TaxID=13249 RepID=T1HAA8_RHOPR